MRVAKGKSKARNYFKKYAAVPYCKKKVRACLERSSTTHEHVEDDPQRPDVNSRSIISIA
jgi:hypothetical protein